MRRIEPPEQSEDDRETEQEEEVEAFIEAGEREGLLEKEEGEMMRGIVDLDETRVREIMTPRTDIVSLSAEATVAEARSGVLDGGHSKLPVYQGTIDNVVGVMHARDLFRAWRDGQEQARVSDYARTVLFVPETLTAADLLREMRLRTQLAIVVDEYGGIAGLVTLEDLLEEIVGDIRDEHDPEESLVQQEQDGSWLVSALAHVRQIETLFEIEIGERDFDTVGGLVVSAFGRVPQGGEVIERYGLHFETLEADKRRVYRVRIRGPVAGS
ncbi:hypothetical protein ABI59_03035 [Acidobacteria bacterium Mor1]|nr:hypothetical protein ABI59_03035 [Acidobacteria bacterium Mor1]